MDGYSAERSPVTGSVRVVGIEVFRSQHIDQSPWPRAVLVFSWAKPSPLSSNCHWLRLHSTCVRRLRRDPPMPPASEPSPPSPDVTTKRKARRSGPGDRKVWLRDEVRGLTVRCDAWSVHFWTFAPDFHRAGAPAVDFAGMAQRNPLLHCTKQIVADATEHDDRGDGPHDEYEGMFPSPLRKNGRESGAFQELEPSRE